MVSHIEIIGLTGMMLVFISFIVRDWRWLYTFNMAGALLLTLYAYLRRDAVFTIVEAGITLFLAYRLYGEIKSRRGLETRVRSSSKA
jgi:lipid-A-disaccharide synthase-like uncharacterized protein